MTTPTMTQERRFPCGQCGARLEFSPESTALRCPYCGHENVISDRSIGVEELDFRGHLHDLEASQPHQEVYVVKCTACAAETTFDPNVTAAQCAWCGVDIVAQATSKRLLTPKGALPFKVERRRGLELFHTWIGSLWFAPNALRRLARNDDRLQGVYIPFWTFDSNTASQYRGERGDDYFVTESYTTTENGQRVTRQRQVRRTRWRNVSGHVSHRFDDVLVLASETVPKQLAISLEPWDLENLEAYRDEFLTGFRAESYQVPLEAGFEEADKIMEVEIRRLVRHDIGGDHQRIHSLQTRHSQITFKHILLPIWVSSYRYHDKVYRFLVNGRTGEVQGERPYSGWKIFFAVLVVSIVIGAIVLFNQQR